jgi:tetratricopeptide (TPR) repeat protein
MPILIALLLAAAPDNTAQAREHFKSAQLHYSLGEFEAAVKDFREAYRLRQEPAILFNVAQSYRQLHKYSDAYFYYRQYLSQKPDAANREEVESLIAQVQYQMDQEKEQETRIARDPAAAKNSEHILGAAQPHAGTQPAPQPAVAGTSTVRIAGFVALGAGAVGEGLAFVLHGSAQSAADQFNQKYAAGQLTAQDAQLKSTAQSRGKLATAAVVGGALLLVTGAVLCFAF